jgi:threonine dehydrogenase-like Zn-dependent dehydrogenase
MKQVLQNIKTGTTELVNVPEPGVKSGHIRIRTQASLVSAGTERTLLDFGKAGWIEKARQQPDKVKQVLDKMRTDGIVPTVEAVFNKLDEPMPLGYCNAGVVLEVGAGITDLHVGDRVASNGPHAEVVCMPTSLYARYA